MYSASHLLSCAAIGFENNFCYLCFMKKFQIGDQSKISVKVTDQMIRTFADFSGDYNPVHLDEEFAAKSLFGRRIAHGMITACLISRALATEIPGPGAIYLGQTLKFKAPVFVEDEIVITLKVTALREEKGILTIQTQAHKVNGELVLDGEATVLAKA